METKSAGPSMQGHGGHPRGREALLREEFDEATLDAALIAAAQRVEHYEIAAYGTLIAWARQMDQVDAARLLERILAEEKAADAKLSSLAESGINEEAGELDPVEGGRAGGMDRVVAAVKPKRVAPGRMRR